MWTFVHTQVFPTAPTNLSSAFADKGIDINELMGKIDMDAVKEMAKDIDLKDMSPEKMKEMAEKIIK